jgi:hypothetical protein
MYTGQVVKFRVFAFVLALLVAATPVLGAVCQIDCDQAPAAPACHQSMSKPVGPIVRGTHHSCDHDHTGGSPALLANATARDSAASVVGVSVPTATHEALVDVRLTVTSTHGPPGPNSLSTSSLITILRI